MVFVLVFPFVATTMEGVEVELVKKPETSRSSSQDGGRVIRRAVEGDLPVLLLLPFPFRSNAGVVKSP